MSSHFLIHQAENGATVSKQWSDRWCESDPTIFTRSPKTIVEWMRVALLSGSLWIGRRTMNMHSPVGAAKPGFGEIWGDEPPFFMGMSWECHGERGENEVCKQFDLDFGHFGLSYGFMNVLWILLETLIPTNRAGFNPHWLRQDTPNAELTY